MPRMDEDGCVRTFRHDADECAVDLVGHRAGQLRGGAGPLAGHGEGM